MSTCIFDDILEKYEISDSLYPSDPNEVFVINYKYPIEIEYEKIKVKFGKKLFAYLNDIKHEPTYFNKIYEKFFNIWKKIAIEKNSMSLFILINYLTKKEAYNIKNTIFGNVNDENLSEKVYYKFICEFISL
jgi:hypothetical protein